MAQSEQIVRFHNPASMPKSVGYSQIVEVTGGRTFYIAGQVAFDLAGQIVGPGDLQAQTVQVFENLAAALAAVGADFQHVVKFNFYLLDITQIPVVRAVRDRYIDMQQPPASTAVEVGRLFRDELLIEVDAIAVVP
ncbi:MAG TPA: RidA family protein [Roseiflexaceae bacterium]|nr:RidA family protein [Roseiflexaceae bacterium]